LEEREGIPKGREKKEEKGRNSKREGEKRRKGRESQKEGRKNTKGGFKTVSRVTNSNWDKRRMNS
jgi:hypothetical protein